MNMKLSKPKRGSVRLHVGSARVPVFIAAGPWIAGIDPAMIKLRAVNNVFPAQVARHLLTVDNSNRLEDYFESQFVRLFPGHPLYAQAKALA